MASRDCGANRTAGGSDPDRQAFMAWRGQSLPLPVSHWRKGSVGPQLEKAPRWSAERGPGRTGKVRALPARASRSHARQKEKRVRLSALHPPLDRG